MRINRFNYDSALAEKCWGLSDLAKHSGVPISTLARAQKGNEVLPKTAGAVARALEVPVEFLCEKERHNEYDSTED